MKRSDWLSLEIQTCQSKLSTSLMHMYMESSPDHPLGRKKTHTIRYKMGFYGSA